MKWHSGDEIDGLTTNGVFIMQPQGGFSPTARPNVWREVSVDGGIFPLRESRPSPLKSCQVPINICYLAKRKQLFFSISQLLAFPVNL